MSHSTPIDIAALYTDHHAWLHNWLRRRHGCTQRAADLAQDTFCRLLEWPELTLTEHPRRYLATVARRLLIDDSRRARAECSFLEAWTLLADTAAPSPERIATAIDELAAIAQLLDGLPAKARRAFLLSRLDGLGYREIAAELDVSTSMVKQYIARVLSHCYALVWSEA
jgi:RNA polymerase sigma-70 factor (ECF subfamily)